MSTIPVTRTYLELLSPAGLKPAFGVFPELRVTRVTNPVPALYRALYRGVGEDYHWRDRWDWPDGQIAAHLAQPSIHLYLAEERGARVGFYELKQDAEERGAVEIAYFGLFPNRLGRGLGKHLLSHAVTEAFALGATRVWLHTCTLDHPAALPNYRARGFVAFKTEAYEVEGY